MKSKGSIRSSADIDRGVRALRRKCRTIRKVHDFTGPPRLRRRRSGFPGLVRIIIAQQVSTASANAIWTRVEAGINPLTPDRILQLDDRDLASCGLSRPKIRSLRALSDALSTGSLKLQGKHIVDDETLRGDLMQIPGIGPWTADIYLMFCLGRPDAFAPGDLAIQVAMQRAFDLPSRPSVDETNEIAMRWQPWRAVAARLLWLYYEKTRVRGPGLSI